MRFPILRSIAVLLWAGVLAGVVVAAGLTMGYYGWPVFGAAMVAGLAGGLPLGLWTAGRMRATPPLVRPESPTMDPDAARREADPKLNVAYPPAPAQGEA